MRRKATCPRPGYGFTLLEILVVVAIVAILTGFAVLRLRGAGVGDVLDTETRRLAALTGAACEQAILQARPLGLRISAAGYDFRVAGDDAWAPVIDRRFRAREFPDAVDVTLEIEGYRVALRRETEVPQVICTAAGELTTFALSMEAGGVARRVSGYTDGEVRVE